VEGGGGSWWEEGVGSGMGGRGNGLKGTGSVYV
jgi:hypothetical protein